MINTGGRTMPTRTDHQRAIRRKSYIKCREKRLREATESNLMRQFGISWTDYQFLHIIQQGRCAVCHNSEVIKVKSGTTKRLSVDHDHNTGQIRGLLCSHCNHGLGNFKDSIEYLKAAIQYLKVAKESFCHS
jgi:hypothetical protein